MSYSASRPFDDGGGMKAMRSFFHFPPREALKSRAATALLVVVGLIAAYFLLPRIMPLSVSVSPLSPSSLGVGVMLHCGCWGGALPVLGCGLWLRGHRLRWRVCRARASQQRLCPRNWRAQRPSSCAGNNVLGAAMRLCAPPLSRAMP